MRHRLRKVAIFCVHVSVCVALGGCATATVWRSGTQGAIPDAVEGVFVPLSEGAHGEAPLLLVRCRGVGGGDLWVLLPLDEQYRLTGLLALREREGGANHLRQKVSEEIRQEVLYGHRNIHAMPRRPSPPAGTRFIPIPGRVWRSEHGTIIDYWPPRRDPETGDLGWPIAPMRPAVSLVLAGPVDAADPLVPPARVGVIAPAYHRPTHRRLARTAAAVALTPATLASDAVTAAGAVVTAPIWVPAVTYSLGRSFRELLPAMIEAAQQANDASDTAWRIPMSPELAVEMDHPPHSVWQILRHLRPPDASASP